MMNEIQNQQALQEAARQAYANEDFTSAAQLFNQLAEAYQHNGQHLDAAEMKNNQSVALLSSGNAKAALEAASGTDTLFAEAGDLRRQGMALGNLASALEALGRIDEAVSAYEQSVELLAEAGEGDMKAAVAKSLATLKLRQGKMHDMSYGLLDYLTSLEKPNLWQRMLRAILRIRL